MEAGWRNPERGQIWTYWSPQRGVLGLVWKDQDSYAATGPPRGGEDYHHAEFGEYRTLEEAKQVIEDIAEGRITERLPVSRPRVLETLRGGPFSGAGGGEMVYKGG